MSTDSLSPAGSSVYSSGTLTVGDGTWDSSRNDFLLPNLVGLNFATMQYNGMGNRFRDLPQYHTLIRGHAILAAIVFLGLVPLAIFIAKFGPRKHLSFRLHVYIQIVVVLLTTVVLVLGWFAVGPERSLTNPHHGIGVAIYTLVLVQFLYGWWMYGRERKRDAPPRGLPKKVWLHRVFGRSIAILAIVQIALGLTLYGSPKVLFILYALYGFLLLITYLVLDYRHKQGLAVFGGQGSDGGSYTDYNGSYLSGSRTDFTQDDRRRPQREEKKSHWGRNLLAAGGALGAYEAWKHRRGNQREERGDPRVDTESQYDEHRMPAPDIARHRSSSRPPVGASAMTPVRSGSRRRPDDSRLSPESWEDEKYSASPPRNTWRDRVLGVGAGVGAGALLGRMLGRKRQDEEYVERTEYRPPLGGNQNMVSRTDISRVQNGEAPFSPGDQMRSHGPMPEGGAVMPPMAGPPASGFTPSRPSRLGRQSTDMYSYDSRDSVEESRLEGDRPHTLRNSIATFGALAGFREWNKARKQRNDNQRIDGRRRQEMEEADGYNRRNSMNYPRRQDGRRPSMSETVLTGATQDVGRGSNPELSRTRFNGVNTNAPPLPAGAGLVPPMGMVSTNSRHDVTEQGYVLPPPPPGPPPGGIRPGAYAPPIPGSAYMPTGAVEPDPSRLVQQNTLANEGSAYGRTVTTDPTVTSGPSTGAATLMTSGQRTNSQSPSRYHSRDDSRNRMRPPEQGTFSRTSVSQLGSSAAPTSPVRVHVQMRDDAVTFQRLPDDTSSAAAAARRQERRNSRRRRTSSVSSGLESDAPPGSNRRYRRNGAAPVRSSAQQPITNVPPPPAMSSVAGSNRPPSELNLPPPPRVPTHSESPQSLGMSPPGARPPVPMAGSRLSNAVGSPPGGAYGTDAGTGTDLSAFADNRKRRRAERARRQAGQRVEFE
ncbi:hypothetical protein LTR95_013168 [Oleoguttula sp. CCFEE 5521]